MKNEGYIVEKNYSSLNCDVLVEPEVNHVATEYIADNYYNLIKFAKTTGIDPNKAEELVHDVWVSLAVAENEGRGYDISHSNPGDIITPDKFVIGRIKKYAENKKYAHEGCDQHTRTKKVKDASGEEKTVTITDFDIAFASANTNDPDQMTSLQRAYYNAHSYEDEIDIVDDELSLRKDIQFCMEFDDDESFSIINLFKNIDWFSEAIDSSIFDGLRAKVQTHDEFGEALMNVLTCAKNHRGIFDMVMATL